MLQVLAVLGGVEQFFQQRRLSGGSVSLISSVGCGYFVGIGRLHIDSQG